MALYGPDNRTNLIADDDRGTDRNAKIIANLMPGTYFIQVRHYNSTDGGVACVAVRLGHDHGPVVQGLAHAAVTEEPLGTTAEAWQGC
jgi:hypothetical protein